MKNFHFLLSCLLISGSFISAYSIPTSAEAEIIDGIAAIIDDHVVTLSDIMFIVPVYLQVIGVDPSQLQTEEGRAILGQELVDYVINTKLIVAYAEEYGMAITDSELDTYIRDRRTQMRATEEQFEQALATNGISLEEFREFMRDNLTMMRMLQIDVVENINITEEQVDREIAIRYPDGLVDTYITTSHLLVQVGTEGEEVARTRIYELAQELGNGTPFEALALQNPDATSARRGRVGRFRLGQLDETYQQTAIGLEIGQISEPIRSQFGWHIIRLENLEQQPVRDAQRIRNEITSSLQQEMLEIAQIRYFEQLRETAFVEVISTNLPW